MPYRRLSSVVVVSAVVLSLASGSSADDAPALADRVIARPCPPYVLGDPRHPWPWAPVGCDAFTAAALVSIALDDGRPEVLRAAADRLDRLAAHALEPASQQPFRSTGRGRDGLARSVLYRGLVLVTL